jgi:hypothetical protein
MKMRFVLTIFWCLFASVLTAQNYIETVNLKHWKDHTLYDDSLYGKFIVNKNLIKKGMERKLAEFLFLYYNPNLKEAYEKNPTFYKKQVKSIITGDFHEVHAGSVSFEIIFQSDRWVQNGWNTHQYFIPLSKIEPFLKN